MAGNMALFISRTPGTVRRFREGNITHQCHAARLYDKHDTHPTTHTPQVLTAQLNDVHIL